jgi:AcrR family transcriptional regulator
MAELLTMSGLVARTTVPRTSIHFYLREGLLPRPQRKGPNRAFYTADHVRLLEKIRQLKDEGLSLADIKERIADELATIENRDEGLIGQEDERIRRAILRVATEEFLSHGYDQARIADIVCRAGVNTKVFYSLFPSKAELLVQSFKTFISWELAYVEPRLEGVDPGERLLWRLHADAGATEFSSSVLSLVFSETPNREDLARQIEEAWAPLMDGIGRELEAALPPGVGPPVSLELLAYSLVGANHNCARRASWDSRYSREDAFATHLWLFLAILDALGRQAEPDPHIARYRDMIKEIASRSPESPPALPN